MRSIHLLIIGGYEEKKSDYRLYNKIQIDKIKKLAPGIEISFAAPDKKDVLKQIKGVHVVITPDVSLVDLKAATSLEWIHTITAGVHRAVEILKETDIVLSNSSGIHPTPIAEHVFGMLLMRARRLDVFCKAQVTDQRWLKGEPEPIFELSKKTIGIIGFGRIGEKIARLAKGFEMHVLACSTTHRFQANIDSWNPPEKLENILRQSDIIVNCLPYTEATHHMFGKKQFEQMKNTAIFVNIGRGKTVNESDLIKALQKNTIQAACLDVFEEEPLTPKSPLWNMDNVIITPHDAGRTPKYLDRMVTIFCKNLRAFLAERPLPNAVDMEKGY